MQRRTFPGVSLITVRAQNKLLLSNIFVHLNGLQSRNGSHGASFKFCGLKEVLLCQRFSALVYHILEEAQCNRHFQIIEQHFSVFDSSNYIWNFVSNCKLCFNVVLKNCLLWESDICGWPIDDLVPHSWRGSAQGGCVSPDQSHGKLAGRSHLSGTPWWSAPVRVEVCFLQNPPSAVPFRNGQCSNYLWYFRDPFRRDKFCVFLDVTSLEL